MLPAPKILIVDDTQDNVDLLVAALGTEEESRRFATITEPAKALQCVAEFEPDLIILDLMMHEVDGFSILEEVQRRQEEGAFLPIVVITANCGEECRRRALSLGATDFITRPHQLFDVRLRVNNLLRARELQLRCQHHNQHLERAIHERTQLLEAVNWQLEQKNEELKAAHLETKLGKRETLERLALVGEHHDDDTGAHTRRVAKTSALLCAKLGLPEEDAYFMQLAAPLHDVGKIGVPHSILHKSGRLTPAEFDIVKTHCEIGRQILDGGRSELLRMACQIAFYHHERFDGRGYPNGLAGEDIPIEGRIVAVADVFDALTHERPYKQAWPISEAVAEIKRQSGQQFDPEIVDAFLSLDHKNLV